jgi:hypothetical protein
LKKKISKKLKKEIKQRKKQSAVLQNYFDDFEYKVLEVPVHILEMLREMFEYVLTFRAIRQYLTHDEKLLKLLDGVLNDAPRLDFPIPSFKILPKEEGNLEKLKATFERKDFPGVNFSERGESYFELASAETPDEMREQYLKRVEQIDGTDEIYFFPMSLSFAEDNIGLNAAPILRHFSVDSASSTEYFTENQREFIQNYSESIGMSHEFYEDEKAVISFAMLQNFNQILKNEMAEFADFTDEYFLKKGLRKTNPARRQLTAFENVLGAISIFATTTTASIIKPKADKYQGLINSVLRGVENGSLTNETNDSQNSAINKDSVFGTLLFFIGATEDMEELETELTKFVTSEYELIKKAVTQPGELAPSEQKKLLDKLALNTLKKDFNDFKIPEKKKFFK